VAEILAKQMQSSSAMGSPFGEPTYMQGENCMADNRSRMTFEEFTQSAMTVIDRALEASRASEKELVQKSHMVDRTSQQLPRIEGFQEPVALQPRETALKTQRQKPVFFWL